MIDYSPLMQFFLQLGVWPRFDRHWINDVNPVSGQHKRRMICAPNTPMFLVHAGIVKKLRSMRVRMPNATACRPGDSAYRNVLRHRKCEDGPFNRYFLLIDIASAYQNVRLENMVDTLVAIKPGLQHIREELRQFLQLYCFDEQLGGLITGAPASPDLFNLYCETRIDREMRMLCRRYGLTYSRYLDDLTFSSTQPIGKKKRLMLRKVIERANFRISDHKAKVYDLRKGPAVVNGIGITLYGKVFLPRRTLRHLSGLLHMALTQGLIDPAQIHGKMGLLKGVTSRQRANRTERKVFEMYAKFRRLP